MTVTIRQMTEDDWLIFSQIRLQALQIDPQAFGSNYEKESTLTETDWRSRLRRNAIFLISEAETPIGVTAAGIDINDPTGKTVLFWGSWLAPEFRGKNLSDLMYRTRIEWAYQQPLVERIIVSHRASNVASKRANQKHDFVLTHIEEMLWSDGATEDLLCYELKIKR